jgi:hypothetical protein
MNFSVVDKCFDELIELFDKILIFFEIMRIDNISNKVYLLHFVAIRFINRK